MTVQLDPEQVEINLLKDYMGSLVDKRILEIGCGNGRLTWTYAGQAFQVVGIDPKAEAITDAIENLPKSMQGKVDFEACTLEEYANQHYEAMRHKKFDLAFLSWSL